MCRRRMRDTMRKKRLSTDRSDFKNYIKDFIKEGGRVQKLPDEIEWDMFPYNDSYAMEKEKNEKGILDYEESRKFVRGEVYKDERR